VAYDDSDAGATSYFMPDALDTHPSASQLPADQWNPLAILAIVFCIVLGPPGGLIFGWIALGRFDRRGGRGRTQVLVVLVLSHAVILLAATVLILDFIYSHRMTWSSFE
jgi:hypothetical protein